MPKIIIQAGHEGRTTGATGAPGEQNFNIDTANRVAYHLQAKGFEVKRVKADPTNDQIAGDWDLFLTIHYDADTYNDHGGFVDFPEPSTDGATTQSQKIAKALTEVYFPITGIKNMPSRSNKNTRFYYMWSRMSAKTPCVIIECGVGNRKPKDFDVLNQNRELAVKGIVSGILRAFNMEGTMPDTMTVERKDWDRLFKASQLGDKLINGLGSGDLYSGNIADKTELDIQKMIDKHNDAALENKFNEGKSQAPSQPTTDPNLKDWEPNGLTIEVVDGNKKTITNYKKR